MRVTDPSDPRLGDFTALNDPAHRRRVERAGDYFVVEGVLAIERLLALPDWQIRCLAVLPRVHARLAPILDARQIPLPEVVVAEEDVLREVVGFDLHRGALASVNRRPPTPPTAASVEGVELLVVAEGVNDHENLGAIYRNAAAFGVGGVVLDPGCADPFYRRSVRVSLGHVLAVPTLGCRALPEGIDDLDTLGVTTVALSPTASTSLTELHRCDLPPGPVAVLVGAEGPGLTPAAMARAHHRVAIPMAQGVDSLNVATALAVALYQLRQPQTRTNDLRRRPPR